MKRVGEVVGVAQGLVIVRSPDDGYPAVGTELLTEELTAVGRVVDAFGPAARPYVAVTPTEGVSPASLLGERLYAR
jgi:RNA-binding protein